MKDIKRLEWNQCYCLFLSLALALLAIERILAPELPQRLPRLLFALFACVWKSSVASNACIRYVTD